MKYILVLILGLVVGGGAIFYFFVRAPRAHSLPGTLIKPPDQNGGDPPGTAIVSIDEKFFDAVLGSIFRDLKPPSFPLQLSPIGSLNSENGPFNYAVYQGDCNSEVVLVPEGSGVTSGLHLTEGKIVTPLAFSGSYSAPIFGCLRFKGWASANMDLSFDAPSQTVYGRINVDGVNLEGMDSGANNIVTGLVQNAINKNVNPIQILRAQQLTLSVPVKASNGTLKAQVKDVRSEIKEGAIRLHITYDFSGVKNQ